MAIELEPAMTLLGGWAYRNMQASVALEDPNPDYLMWQIRRTIDRTLLPQRRVVIRFHFANPGDDQANYWLIAKPSAPLDLCMSDPGFDVDLFVEAEFKALTSAWMGYSSLQAEISHDRIFLSGDPLLVRAMEQWLGKCPHAVAAE